MTKSLMTALAIMAMLGLVACGESAVDLDTGTDRDAIVSSVEDEIFRLGDEIEASDIENELGTAWESLETRLTSAVEAVRSGEAVDIDAIEAEVKNFQSNIENSEAADTVRDTWNTLRVQIEQMLSQLG